MRLKALKEDAFVAGTKINHILASFGWYGFSGTSAALISFEAYWSCVCGTGLACAWLRCRRPLPYIVIQSVSAHALNNKLELKKKWCGQSRTGRTLCYGPVLPVL